MGLGTANHIAIFLCSVVILLLNWLIKLAPGQKLFKSFHACSKTDWNVVLNSCIARVKPCEAEKVEKVDDLDKIVRFVEKEMKPSNNIFFFKNGPISASFCLFSSFPQHTIFNKLMKA